MIDLEKVRPDFKREWRIKKAMTERMTVIVHDIANAVQLLF